MAAVTSSSVIYFLFTIIIGLIAIPFCIYSITQFYNFKDDRRFKKRHGKLSTFTALCFVGELFSGCLLTLAFSGFASIHITIALAWIGDIFNFMFYFLIIHCLVLRFWCLYYDIKYQLSTNDNLWKSMIDEHYIVNQEHLSQVKSFDIEDDLWFIKNKNREGNAKWMLKTWFFRSFLAITTLLSTMIAIEMIFTVGLRRGVIEVIFTILFFIPWFLMIYIYHKIPQFFDTYFIRKEIVVIHNIDLVDVIASALVSIIANYGIYSANMSSSGNPYNIILENDWLNILMIITFYVMGISHIIIIYIMTYWVRGKIIEDEKHITSLKQRASSYDVHFYALNNILEQQYGYELFMEHLANEFSIENLLSLTEFMQYKLMIKHTFHITDDELMINLPMGYIPQSSIVYETNKKIIKRRNTLTADNYMDNIDDTDNNNNNNNNDNTDNTDNDDNNNNNNNTHNKVDNNKKFGKIIYKLYFKYIRIGAELEVNISWETRNIFNKYIDSNNKTIHENILLNDDEYYTIFDNCILEVLRLMKNDSYARFTHTERYKKLKNAMENS